MSLAPPFRASAPVLLPAGAVAGFGLGLGALAALMPAASVPPLPPLAPVAAMPAPADTGDTAAASRTGWAPLFGFAVPAPAARFEPEPEPAQSPEVYLDLDGYLLQGLVVENEDGYALTNTDDGVVLVRAGDQLPDGTEVLTVTPEGVELQLGDDVFLLTFQDSTGSVDVGAYDGAVFDTRGDGPVGDARGGDPEGRTIPSRRQRSGTPGRLVPAGNDENDHLLRDRFGISR